MGVRRSLIGDYLTRAFRAKDAKELEDLEKEAAKKIGDAVETETPTGSTGEPSKTPEGESLHIHLHNGNPIPSAGAGGSATADDDLEPAGAGTNPGSSAPGVGGPDSAVLKAITDLSAKFDALIAALTGSETGGGESGSEWNGMSEPEQDGDLDIHHSADGGDEERFEPDPNKKIRVGGFGAEAPPGAAGAQNSGSRDRRGRGRDSAARDSGALVESWQEMLALAEIISPGVRLPTFDSRARAATTLDAMCKFKRRIMNVAYDTDMALHNDLDNLFDGGYSPKMSMTCDAVSAAFRALASLKRERNNQMLNRDGLPQAPAFWNAGFRSASPYDEALSLADLNARNKERAASIWGTGGAPAQ
jgi:hypothetical protein